jgi:tetratricopeptide (TPR) repeat protein
MMQTIRVDHLGKSYLWNGTAWTDDRFLRPPTGVRSALMQRLLERLAEPRAEKLDRTLVIEASRACMDEGLMVEAVALAERVLEIDPRHAGAAVALAEALRKQRLPRRAIRVTEPFQRRRDAALLTVRAAAYCDISEWDKAETLVRRAITISRADSTAETLHVFARVIAARARNAA